MIINKLFRYHRQIILGTLPLLFCLLLDLPVFARGTSDEVRGTNVKWAIKNEVITVNYDLLAPSDSKYDVSILMKRENDPSFIATPVTMEGDVAEGFFAGPNREIRWYFRRDYPQGFTGEGYYFEIHVTLIAQHSSWIYYAVGAGAVTAGLVLLLAGKSQGKQSGINELPLPPGRP